MGNILSILKLKIRQNKTLVANFGYLSILKIFTTLIPLLTLPYLLNVLGKDKYGLIVFAQAIIQYFIVIISFGFNISATKEVSSNRGDVEKLSCIVSSIYIIKGFLFVFSLLTLLIFIYVIPQLRSDKILFLLTMHIGLFEWLFPVWFFQGIEKMKYITVVNLLTRLLFLSLIFLFIKEQKDYIKVPIINGIGSVIAGFTSIWIVYRREGVRFRWQSYNDLRYYFIDSLHIFLGSVASRIKLLTNKVVLGMFVDMNSVALYDIADKIKQVFLYFLEIVVATIYPNVSKTRNKNLVKKTFKWLIVSGICIYLIIGLSLQIILPLYFKDYIEVINIFWILGIVLFIQPLTYLIGVTILVINDLNKVYSRNLYWMTVIYLFILLILYVFDIMNVYAISGALVIAILLELLSKIYICKKYKLLHWLV